MTTQVKIFGSENKRTDLLEDRINEWLLENQSIKILDILTTSHAAATGDFSFEEFYLTIVYTNS